jgi:hypothetical protein
MHVQQTYWREVFLKTRRLGLCCAVLAVKSLSFVANLMQFQDIALEGILIMDLLRKKEFTMLLTSRLFPETRQLTWALSEYDKF